MILLASLVLLIALDLAAWRWVTTPATAVTGRPDRRAAVATREDDQCFEARGQLAWRRRWLLIATRAAVALLAGPALAAAVSLVAWSRRMGLGSETHAEVPGAGWCGPWLTRW
jgi:hypothetical protein